MEFFLSFFGGFFAHVATYTFGGGHFIYDGRLGGLLPFFSTLEPCPNCPNWNLRDLWRSAGPWLRSS